MKCCDGTGWTGNPKAPLCPTHYEPCGDLLAMSYSDVDPGFEGDFT